MGMERTLIPGLLELTTNLVSTAQDVSIKRAQCKMLADLVTGFIPLFHEIQRLNIVLTAAAVENFRLLMHALLKAQRVITRMKESSKVQLFFRNVTLSNELSVASSEIQACLSSLPLVHLRISAQMYDEIKVLKVKLGVLGKELKDSNSVREDQQELASEITEVLREHNTSEASSSGASCKVMDKLLVWLAERFDSDVETVRREWEVMKEEAVSLREQIEFTSENKRQLEEELLQTMVYIDSEERPCKNCTSQKLGDLNSAVTEVDPPNEFLCPICLQLLTDPVITDLGFTYCRSCITGWLEQNDTCPNTRGKLQTKILVSNIALKNFVSRWRESQYPIGSSGVQAGPRLPALPPNSPSSSDGSGSHTISDYIEVRLPFLGDGTITPGAVSPGNALSPSSSVSSGFKAPVKAVTTHISLLSSKKSMQILKSLKELTHIARFPKGQLQIFEAGGIPAVAKLLKEKDNSISEKAAGVLEALTFEIKGDADDANLSYEERDQICGTVTDVALDLLIDLMQYGSHAARLNAAQTVANVLVDEDIRAEILHRSGVVSAFYALTKAGEGFLFPNEGKSLCIKGLNLLSGDKAIGLADDAALTSALLRLAANNASPESVEESLLALSLLVDFGGENVCNIMHANNAIPFLVRSISRLPSGRGREEALKILNEMSLQEAMQDVIVKSELFSHLFPVLNEANDDEGECLNEATRLLSMCLSSVKGDISLLLSQIEVKSFVGLLALERTSAASKLDILSALQHLCRESLKLRVAFLNNAGVATLQGLANSEIPSIKVGVARIINIIAAFPACHKEIIRQGGMEILNSLLMDDNLECCSHAVVAAECLLTGSDMSLLSLDGFPFESTVDLLGPTYSLESRQAAVGILHVFASRNVPIVWDKKIIELLLDILQSRQELPIIMRKKSADVLLLVARKDSSTCIHFLEADGLLIFIEFALKLGPESKPLIIHLLCAFCKGDGNCKLGVVEVGGCKFLLEALEKVRLKEEAAIALENLAETIPARKAILQAGFVESAIKCILSNGGSQCSINLTRALITVLDKTNVVKVRELEGVQALVLILDESTDLGKAIAAAALTKLMKLDPESLALLGQVEGISALWRLSVLQQSTGNSLASDNVEALEALSAAAESQNNKMLIVQEGAIPLLLSISTGEAPRAQELALNILLKLSREGVDPVEYDICGALINAKITKVLLSLIHIHGQPSSCASEIAIYSAICIIRNLSLAGITARTAMLEEGEGVIKILLDRIRHHEENGGIEIAQVAVIALERFMLDSRGKMALIRNDGIRVIVQVLHHGQGVSSKAKSFATKILVMMAQDPQISKQVCQLIFESKVIPGLRDILEFAPTSECKKQAANLLKFLMYSGPRAAVCKCIREEECIPKLLDLRADILCLQAANETLGLLKSYDRESRRYIAEADDQN